MRILVIADDESLLNSWDIEGQIDLLISCGDIADQVILEAARRSHCQQILAVKGNHDSSGDFPPQIRDLHLNVIEFQGLKFGGFAGAWKYKPRGNYLFEQQEVASMLSWFPKVDIFVAHNSPRHIHDQEDEVHFGFDAFNAYIQRTEPKLFLHGHQHVSTETVLGGTSILGTYGKRILSV